MPKCRLQKLLHHSKTKVAGRFCRKFIETQNPVGFSRVIDPSPSIIIIAQNSKNMHNIIAKNGQSLFASRTLEFLNAKPKLTVNCRNLDKY